MIDKVDFIPTINLCQIQGQENENTNNTWVENVSKGHIC